MHAHPAFLPAFVTASASPANLTELATPSGAMTMTKTIMNTRPPGSAGSASGRSNRWGRGASQPRPRNSQNAQASYERYMTLARAEAQNGNTIGAENYYQYAEHYFRSMHSDAEGT
jgi:hypothetical protein